MTKSRKIPHYGVGELVKGQDHFYYYEREGEARRPDFWFERLGEQGGERQRRLLDELASQSPAGMRHLYAPDNIQALNMVSTAVSPIPASGQVVREATHQGHLRINQRYVFGTSEPKFFLAINALVTGDMVFSVKDAEDELYTTGGPTIVQIDAVIRGSFMLRAEPVVSGGLGSKTIHVCSAFLGDLEIITRGATNYCDWTLAFRSTGAVAIMGNRSGKMMHRKLVLEESFDETSRVHRVVVTDVPE